MPRSDPSSEPAAMYSLRPATHDDYEYLYALHVATMKDYVAQTWGWDDEMQAAMFREHFAPAAFQIVVVGARSAGAVAIERRAEDVFIAGIEIDPAYQRRGIGTAIIRATIDSARAAHLPTALQVLKINPAHGLYERLGFVTIGSTDTHYLMRTVE